MIEVMVYLWNGRWFKLLSVPELLSVPGHYGTLVVAGLSEHTLK